MQTILGSGGTIGTELAKALPTYTDQVRLVSRKPKAVNPTDELVSADLSDAAQVDRAVAGSDIVYLTVGYDYKIDVWRAKWPVTMQNVIAACQKHGAKLVFFDNVYMYDCDYLNPMTEETPIRPTSRKGEVRAEIAGMLLNAIKAGTLTALIARSADFYGPNNDKSVLVETVVKNLKKGKAANWFASLDHVHTFTYTPDAARATALLGNTPDAYGQVWHVPTHTSRLTGREWVNLFAKEMNVAPKASALPVWMIGVLGWFVPIMKEFKEMSYQYDRDYVFDSSKFATRFDLKPTEPLVGVRETVRGN
ncbi:NAD-dependent epimerase/dehydratase family protein [Spirosoma montaniterrae]|uniref:NAD-dependent dehydratase n=1 Tax=Spirosoma montaniterrae TaxID=1178516 RepID=A0A1P9WY70_9BACT|nr:NAD-dependent epimerase/dehydratase family protein [Spirosoma montaniterrae]AQG80310.1 NAD-dependent dehydratase [Spirosoma montaniterrae]